ncbi:MAG: hypothetical protein ACKV22_35665 [Bryobacteraceae bacterium]
MGMIGGLISGPANLIGGIGKAFGKLFGRKKKKPRHQCPQRPMPFQPPFAGMQQTLQGIGNKLGQITDQLGKLVQGLQQGLQGMGQGAGQGGAAGGAQGPMGMQQIVQMLQDMIGKLTGQGGAVGGAQGGGSLAPSTGAGGGSSAGGVSGGNADSIGAAGSKIDGMMKSAEQLMLSENKADQLKGQKMMQDAQNMFQMMSNLIKTQGDMQKAAIQNMRG